MTVGLLSFATNSTPFGKINLGLTGPSTQTNTLPFINILKGADPEITYNNGGTIFTTATPQGTTQSGNGSAFPLYSDANGENVVPLPTGTTAIDRTIWKLASITGTGLTPGNFPPQFAGQQFTVDWQGGSGWLLNVVSSGGSAGVLGFGGTSFTFTWPTTYSEATLIYLEQQVHTGNVSDPPRNIRIYKTSFAVGGASGAVRLAAGQVIDPDYLASISAGAGTFRCMDWMTTINNDVTNSYANIPTETSNWWGVIGSGSSGLRGMPLSVIVKTAIASNKNPHICIPSPFMCPSYKSLISVTKATSPVVTTAGPHTFANGDTVILNSIALSALINPSSYATSTFTCGSAHGMVNGYPLQLGTTDGQNADGSTYPTGVTKVTAYYACNVTSTTFQIASTQANGVAGTNIALSGSMTGTINLFLNMNFNRYTVSNSNPSANTFQLTGPGSDTSIMTSGTGLGGIGMSPYSLSYITTQVGLLAGYFRDNLPATFCPTYELDNEEWNFGTRVFFNFNGQSRGKFSDSPYQVMGYMQAVFAQAVKTAYAGNRSRYKFVFGGNQMFGDLFGAGLQAGWLAYVTDNPGVVATDLFDYLLGNTYFQTSYNGNGSPQTCTFGTNTIAYTGAIAGFPVKLATSSALPSGLVAGTLGTAAVTKSSSQILGTISGNVLTVTMNLADGNSGGSILAGSTIALPGVIPAGTTIAAYGTGGTTGTGGLGTYQISSSLTVSSPVVIWCGTPFVSGTGTIYWLVGTGPNFGLALTPGGSPVAFTGPGTGTHTATRCPCDVVQFLITQSIALNGSTPATYPTPFTYYNQAISDDLYDARWTAGIGSIGQGTHFNYCILSAIDSYNYYYTTYLAPGKLLAGLSQTSYEGGYNGPPQDDTFLLKNDPTWQAMYYSSNYSQGQADNLSQMDIGCRTVPNGFYKTSQFLDTNPFGVQNQSGTYGAKEYIGDTNLRWQGVVSVNNS